MFGRERMGVFLVCLSHAMDLRGKGSVKGDLKKHRVTCKLILLSGR